MAPHQQKARNQRLGPKWQQGNGEWKMAMENVERKCPAK